jgi:hypothetical protein
MFHFMGKSKLAISNATMTFTQYVSPNDVPYNSNRTSYAPVHVRGCRLLEGKEQAPAVL